MEHPLRRDIEMVFACKKCKKTFRKDMTVYDDSDEYCPHCDNHYVRLYASLREMEALRSVIGLVSDRSRVDASAGRGSQDPASHARSGRRGFAQGQPVSSSPRYGAVSAHHLTVRQPLDCSCCDCDARMLRDDRVEEQRMKGLQESLRELDDLMAECVYALFHNTSGLPLTPHAARSEVKLDQRPPPKQQEAEQ